VSAVKEPMLRQLDRADRLGDELQSASESDFAQHARQMGAE